MTEFQEQQVLSMKQDGLGYKRIAAATGMNPEMVKSFLRRKKHAGVTFPCDCCGTPVIQTPHRKKKRFCNSRCRALWWREHPEMVNRKQYSHICKWCGAPFQSERGSSQYCNRKCYADARRKGDRTCV